MTTIIACFPFVFTQLLGFVGIMGVMMAPVGAIIVTEHWIFPRIGFTRYWSKYKGNTTNWAAVITWLVSLAVSYFLETSGTLHLFFILIPIWIFATVLYIVLAMSMGAKESYSQQSEVESAETQRKATEQLYLQENATDLDTKESSTSLASIAQYIAYAMLLTCAVMGIMSYTSSNIETVRSWLIVPTLIYFVTATYSYLAKQTND